MTKHSTVLKSGSKGSGDVSSSSPIRDSNCLHSSRTSFRLLRPRRTSIRWLRAGSCIGSVRRPDSRNSTPWCPSRSMCMAYFVSYPNFSTRSTRFISRWPRSPTSLCLCASKYPRNRFPARRDANAGASFCSCSPAAVRTTTALSGKYRRRRTVGLPCNARRAHFRRL